MHNRYSINLAWPSEQKKCKEEYRTWIKLCGKYNIKCIRVFLVPWGLNPVESSADLLLLSEVIQLAQQHSIEVILVLDTYVNFVEYSYRDFFDSEFGWFTNRFSGFCSLDSFLSESGKTQYIDSLSNVLREVIRFKNVSKIELCNEIDQIESKKQRVVKWINNSLKVLYQEYGDRFDYRVSISDYRVYSYFSEHIKCKCDIHSYRFPYNTALENYEYLTNTFPNAWISEFACFSDFAYADSIESRTYFCAMLLCATFQKCVEYPAPWWWEKILLNPSYMNIYNYLVDIKDEFVRRDIVELSVNAINQTQKLDTKVKNKIRYRLSVLKRNPRYLKQEWAAITKFMGKKIRSKYNHRYAIVNYESTSGNQYVVLETYIPIEVKYKTRDDRRCRLICKDMTRNQKMIPINLDETRTLNEGTYLLIIQDE